MIITLCVKCVTLCGYKMYYIMRKSYYVMHKFITLCEKVITLCGNYYIMRKVLRYAASQWLLTYGTDHQSLTYINYWTEHSSAGLQSRVDTTRWRCYLPSSSSSLGSRCIPWLGKGLKNKNNNFIDPIRNTFKY